MVSLQAAVTVLALSVPGQTVLYDFYADWCGPCRAMAPTVDQLRAQGYPVQKVNVDENRALAAKYGITNIPCFVMVVGGKEMAREEGATSLSRLEGMCRMATASRQPAPAGQDGGLAQQWPPDDPAHAAPPHPASPRQSVESEGSALPPGTTADRWLIAASVRLYVEDAQGRSCGSGTIVDARDGEALILTCGHIFRDSQGKGRIEVDLFGPGAARGLPGKLISYDPDADVGLVSVRTPGPVSVARIAPADYRLAPGQPVVGVGCNHGADPTAVHSRINSINRYMGAPNLEVAGQSVEGRSGGGVFSAGGYVIGVCLAAQREDDESFCAALPAIHAQLDQANLSFVYREAGEPALVEADPAPPAAPLGELVEVEPPPMPRQMPAPAERAAAPVPILPAVQTKTLAPRLSERERATIEEIMRRLDEGMEVIFVIRSRTDPDAPSEVIVLNGASRQFVEQLVAQSATRDPRQYTSMDTPKSSAEQPSPVPTPGPVAARQMPVAPAPGPVAFPPRTSAGGQRPDLSFAPGSIGSVPPLRR